MDDRLLLLSSHPALEIHMSNHFVHIRSSTVSVHYTLQFKKSIIFSKMSIRHIESSAQIAALKAEVSLFYNSEQRLMVKF